MVLEDNVWVGGQVTVLKGVTVGRDSVLGRGAVVRQSVPARVVVIGNPAKIVKRFPVPDGQADRSVPDGPAKRAEPDPTVQALSDVAIPLPAPPP